MRIYFFIIMLTKKNRHNLKLDANQKLATFQIITDQIF